MVRTLGLGLSITESNRKKTRRNKRTRREEEQKRKKIHGFKHTLLSVI